jgi:(p)ppGpp synthase/HD superfamily hydrolase
MGLAPKLYCFLTLVFCLQTSIAVETLQVFAPLAKLLGMYQIKVWYNYKVVRLRTCMHVLFLQCHKST